MLRDFEMEETTLATLHKTCCSAYAFWAKGTTSQNLHPHRQDYKTSDSGTTLASECTGASEQEPKHRRGTSDPKREAQANPRTNMDIFDNLGFSPLGRLVLPSCTKHISATDSSHRSEHDPLEQHLVTWSFLSSSSRCSGISLQWEILMQILWNLSPSFGLLSNQKIPRLLHEKQSVPFSTSKIQLLRTLLCIFHADKTQKVQIWKVIAFICAQLLHYGCAIHNLNLNLCIQQSGQMIANFTWKTKWAVYDLPVASPHVTIILLEQ